jgi:hypothetical protein
MVCEANCLAGNPLASTYAPSTAAAAEWEALPGCKIFAPVLAFATHSALSIYKRTGRVEYENLNGS